MYCEQLIVLCAVVAVMFGGLIALQNHIEKPGHNRLTMNRKQIVVLCVGIVLFVLIGLFPPGLAGTGKGRNPVPRQWSPLLKTDPDTLALSIRWAVIVVITGAIIYSLRDKPEPRRDDGEHNEQEKVRSE